MSCLQRITRLKAACGYPQAVFYGPGFSFNAAAWNGKTRQKPGLAKVGRIGKFVGMAAPAVLDTLQPVELAEGVEIRLRVAGPLQRIGAYLIDLLIRVALFIVLTILYSISGIALGGQVVTGLVLLTWFVIDWFYPVFFEAGKHGATPGKRMVGLRVVQISGTPITIGQSVVRNFMRFIDGLPMFNYIVGLASCFATRRFQRLGDLAAGTVVVYQRVPPQPGVPAPPPIRAMAPPVGLSGAEVRALSSFRDRSGLWPEARRIEIADQARALSGAAGAEGASRLMAMAHWLRGQSGGGT